ncbi:MAG: ATP-grasp domain-containing protein, partial [Lentisphaeria bacterium]|nr:ATP-grasp domain-containing protein [Lentisphaeria bacterium]
PSFVLGGRGMEVIYDDEMLKRYAIEAIQVSPEYPMLIDRFLDNAIECEVEAVSDGTETFVASIMEHIELAGIHSGDSACAIPPVTISPEHQETIRKYTSAIAEDFKVIGIMNVQYAICEGKVYIIEANPRASRTVPVVSKVTGVALAKLATRLMLGEKLASLGKLECSCGSYYGVKEAVFPFNMFPEVDPVLGPEMRATGEVMGMAESFGLAYYKAEEASGFTLPTSGKVLMTVARRERKYLLPIAQEIHSLGFQICATEGTSAFLTEHGIPNTCVKKLQEGRPNLGDMIKNRELALIINTPIGRESKTDDSYIRKLAIQMKLPYVTTIAAASASVKGIRAVVNNAGITPKSLQEYHQV